MLLSTLTMAALIEAAADRWADKVFISDEDGSTLTFGQFRAAANAVSAALIARGARKDDRIAIWAPNSGAWVIIAAGATQIGLQLIPVNTRFKGAEAADILARGKVRWLFTVNSFLGLDYAAMLEGHDLPHLSEIISVGELDGWLKAGGAGQHLADVQSWKASVRADDIIDILFTSGTTGRPKGAMCDHGQNLRTSEVWGNCVGLRETDRYMIVNPFFHSFGYKAGWLACLLRGVNIYPVSTFDAARVLRQIVDHRITVLPGPPTIFQSLLDVPQIDAYDISSLRLAVTGAASVPPVLIQRMHEDLGIDEVLTAYGLTESCGSVSITTAGDSSELVAKTCGKPIPGVELRQVDGSGRDVPRGTPGELLIRGYNVMRGYLDDPEATREAIDADGWFRTGDIAIQDEGGYLRITDRAKDMFICGGFNCYPAEIEARLLEHPDVARVAVVGRPDERLGEVGHAVAVANPGARPDTAAFLDWCRGAMANYKAPRSVEWVDELPMNAAGKVQRFLLK